MLEKEDQQPIETNEQEIVTDDQISEGAISENEQVTQAGESQTVEEKEKIKEAVYDIDGEKIPASMLKEWRSGYMKDSDYRKKTAAVAEERKKHEAEMEKWKQYQETIEYINSNPDLLAQVNQLLQGHYSQRQVQQPQIPAEFKQELEESRRFREDIQLERELTKLKANPMFKDKITDETEKELLQFALDNRLGNLEVAAKSYFYDKDIAGAKLKGAEEVTDGLKRKGTIKPPIATGLGMSQPPKTKPKNMDEVFATVAEDLGFK